MKVRSTWATAGVVALCSCGAHTSAVRDVGSGAAALEQDWWQRAVFYEIYPRSFSDSNGDGIGDLDGIVSKLDYLKELGVDAIWMTPCFPSPQVDFGYDVLDYENIDPMYGSLSDFDRLVSEANKRGIRTILDLVVNHTSDKHPWFVDSRSSRAAAHRDWYVWRDGKGPGALPNNWTSIFGGPAWTPDPATDQYYYHYFFPQQPDLNWRNPAVQNAMFDVTRWWYGRGVAGFRLDAVDALYEDPQLRDNPVLPGEDLSGAPRQEHKYQTKLPEVHDALRALRHVADESRAILIGETWTDSVSELREYYGVSRTEMQMPMDLMFTQLRFSAPALREHIAAVDGAGGWPVYVIGNHDVARARDRYGDGQHDLDIAKVMAALQLTLRGTPIMYYGEEIGMKTTDPVRREDVKDPIGRLAWPKFKGRDGERTPMQWDASHEAGFTSGVPWLPVAPDYQSLNAAVEGRDPDSILELYRRLIGIRRTHQALLDGTYTPLAEADPNVLSYLRVSGDDAVAVALNTSASPQDVDFDGLQRGYAFPETLLTTGGSALRGGRISLAPFGVWIAALRRTSSAN